MGVRGGEWGSGKGWCEELKSTELKCLLGVYPRSS